MAPVRLAVMGAGLIGRRHIDHIRAEDCADLVGIVDPSPDARALAAALACEWYCDLDGLIAAGAPEGVVIATPNQLHVANGLQALAAGLPVLVEKPIADDISGAQRLVGAAAAADLPLLVGHHRRHNPLIQAARQSIAAGQLGTIVAAHAQCWFHKHDAYFEPDWRRQKGAGPVLTNAIHDVDLLRCLCGDISAVQAMDSRALRGNAVEESAVALLRFTSGALGTVTVSDIATSPWSWEFTSGENPDYTHTDQNCILVSGTHAALAVPSLELWSHGPAPSWWNPIARTRLPAEDQDPLALQIRNFCAVIRGTAAPVMTGAEGLATLKVIAAIQQAAGSGQMIHL